MSMKTIIQGEVTMNRSLVSAVLRRCAPVVFGVCLVLVVAGSGLAANTYTDLKGRFAFDLPEGWKMNSSTADRLFIFKGGSGETMILMYDEEAKDVDKLVETAADTFKDSGASNAVLEGTVKKADREHEPGPVGDLRRHRRCRHRKGEAVRSSGRRCHEGRRRSVHVEYPE